MGSCGVKVAGGELPGRASGPFSLSMFRMMEKEAQGSGGNVCKP